MANPEPAEGWLRIPPIHCEAPTWWQESSIYKVTRSRRLFIGAGNPLERSQKTYKCSVLEARRYESLLSDPFINSQADVARELWITRARVIQIMGLQKLPEEIQGTLLGLNDQRVIRYFSERRLRPLLTIPDPTGQVREFSLMLRNVWSNKEKLIDKT